jgi:hypothetical protein
VEEVIAVKVTLAVEAVSVIALVAITVIVTGGTLYVE